MTDHLTDSDLQRWTFRESTRTRGVTCFVGLSDLVGCVLSWPLPAEPDPGVPCVAMRILILIWVLLTVSLTIQGLTIDIVTLAATSARVLAVGSRCSVPPCSWQAGLSHDSQLLAFVGILTKTKPERREALRRTWFLKLHGLNLHGLHRCT